MLQQLKILCQLAVEILIRHIAVTGRPDPSAELNGKKVHHNHIFCTEACNTLEYAAIALQSLVFE